MRSRPRCAKCRDVALLAVPATPGQHSHIVSGERVLHTVTVTTYVCTRCGYVEQWVDDEQDLLKLRAEWASRHRAG
jgi:predicted nucleic-acid-binding Zn-ribbon protein